MSKILVAYLSQTGNTRHIAEAIHSALEREAVLASIREVDSTDAYDLIFIGFPVHSHSVPFPVEGFLKSIPSGKK